MRRIRNLKWTTATVIVLTVSVAVGVAAWRSSGGSQHSGTTHNNHGQKIEKEAAPDQKSHEHKGQVKTENQLPYKPVVVPSGTTHKHHDQEIEREAAPDQKSHEHKGQVKTENQLPFRPVVVPNGSTLKHKMIDGTKIFHLTAEEFEHEFAPGLKAKVWGYNKGTPGPVIEAVVGDHVKIYVTNKLKESTSVHWHGIILPSGMDGVAGLTQKAILPGETFLYEFTFKFAGTFMYHPHGDEMTQMAMGMVGMIVVHPAKPSDQDPQRDFAMMVHEWSIKAGAKRVNPNEMTDFNVLTINGKAFPGTDALVAKQGEKVRMRFGNLSAMEHHPIHLHGYSFKVVATDGGPIPLAGQWPETTVLVPVGSTRDIELKADYEGDWFMHCHMTHHGMNQMGHTEMYLVGVESEELNKKIGKIIPGFMMMGQNGMGGMSEMGMEVPKNSIPMVGKAGPFGLIDMGGMVTIFKVRKDIASYEDPDWFKNPKGTVAEKVDEKEFAEVLKLLDSDQELIQPQKGEEKKETPKTEVKKHQGH